MGTQIKYPDLKIIINYGYFYPACADALIENRAKFLIKTTVDTFNKVLIVNTSTFLLIRMFRVLVNEGVIDKDNLTINFWEENPEEDEEAKAVATVKLNKDGRFFWPKNVKEYDIEII